MMASTTGLAAPSLDGAVAPPTTASIASVRRDRDQALHPMCFPAIYEMSSIAWACGQNSNGLNTTSRSKTMSDRNPVWEAPVAPLRATSPHANLANTAPMDKESSCVPLIESKNGFNRPSGCREPIVNVGSQSIACGRGLMPNEGKAPSPSPAQMDKESLRVPLIVSKNGFNRPSGCQETIANVGSRNITRGRGPPKSRKSPTANTKGSCDPLNKSRSKLNPASECRGRRSAHRWPRCSARCGG